MNKSTKHTNIFLKTFLFNSPIKFALFSFVSIVVLGLIYSFVSSLFNFSTALPLLFIILISIGFIAYKMLKKLPHISMNQNDFIKIINGQTLISVCVMFLSIAIISNGTEAIRHYLLWLLTTHPILFWLLSSVSILIYLYILGTIIICIYAKYKRALEFNISHWKIICSMPFTFLLMWTPGYLIAEKNSTKEEVTIQSNLYNKIHNYVIANKGNTIFAFIIMICITKLFSGFVPLLTTLGLLILYFLWNIKYKSTFINKISKEYSLMATSINIAIWIAVLVVNIF